jgi:hypothetical protein
VFFNLLKYTVLFEHIEYTRPIMDFRDTQILFTNFFDHPMIKVNIPAIKSWKIQADGKIDDFLLNKDELMVMDLESIDFKFNI